MRQFNSKTGGEVAQRTNTVYLTKHFHHLGNDDLRVESPPHQTPALSPPAIGQHSGDESSPHQTSSHTVVDKHVRVESSGLFNTTISQQVDRTLKKACVMLDSVSRKQIYTCSEDGIHKRGTQVGKDHKCRSDL